jgi:hypothetical protein
MARFFQRLWVGMLTRNEEDADTDSLIALAVKQDRADWLYHLFPDSPQTDQGQGGANLYEVPDTVVAPAKISAESDLEFELHIRGDDAWSPEVVFVWGELLGDEAVIPLALSLKAVLDVAGPNSTPLVLSTDPADTEGTERSQSPPLHKVGLGSADTRMRSCLMLISTSTEQDAGTDNKLHLNMRLLPGPELQQQDFGDTPQEDLETGEANLYQFTIVDADDEDPIQISYDMLGPDAFRLSIGGDDQWTPSSFFLFGIDQLLEDGVNVTSVVPLVHLPVWNLGQMSGDPNEGREIVVLPLAPLAAPVPPPIP